MLNKQPEVMYCRPKVLVVGETKLDVRRNDMKVTVNKAQVKA